MDKIRELRTFIVKNFIIVLLLVAFTESALGLIFNNIIFPKISPLLFKDNAKVEYDVWTGIVFFFYLIVRLIMLFISRYIPIGLGDIDEKVINSFVLFDGNSLVEKYEAISPIVRGLMFVCIILMMVVLLLPIIIAGSVFTARLMARFAALEEEEKKKNLLYEKKRSLLLSDIAHDLRTPITTIYGYSRAILDNKADEAKTEEYLNLICMKAEKVDELVNLLFDYVKIDSEGFTLHKEKTDISELVRQAGAYLYQDIYDAGMELYPDIPDEEIYVEADKVQFSRVVVNLLNNSIKHNPSGTKIGLFLFKDESKIKIAVCDSGPLIPGEIAPNIFEPFKTGDESRKSSGGTGLGLSIAKKITNLHGMDLVFRQGENLPGKFANLGFTKCFLIR